MGPIRWYSIVSRAGSHLYIASTLQQMANHQIVARYEIKVEILQFQQNVVLNESHICSKTQY